jgi:cytolysin-activating lysine-acyltransferase
MQALPKTYADAFGQIVWLLSQSKIHRELKIKDLEWSFMPAVMHEQFRIFRFGPLPGVEPSKLMEQGQNIKMIEQMPLGVAIWAKLSQEAEAKLERGEHLTPPEWKSGDRVWLVELISPYATPENKLQEAMFIDLVSGPFKNVAFSMHRTDPSTGKREKITMDQHLKQVVN